MAKKSIKDKKNLEIQTRLIREAEIMGIKQDDPVLKKALEEVINLNGSSKGRKKILSEQLIKLDEYIKSKANNAAKENTVEKEDKSNLTPEMEELIQERVDKLVKIKLDEILESINQNYKASGLDIENSKVKSIESNINTEREEFELNEDGIGFKELFEAGKNVAENLKSKSGEIYNKTINKTKEKSKEVVDKSIDTYNNTKETISEGVSTAYNYGKDKIEAGVDKIQKYGTKFAKNSIEIGSKQVNNIITFFEKAKSYDIKGKIKSKLSDFAKRFEKSKHDVFEGLESNINYVEEIHKKRKASTINSLMIGDETAGCLYEINEFGAYTKSLIVNGVKGPAYTVNPLEFEREREKYLEANEDLDIDKNLEKEELEMV